MKYDDQKQHQKVIIITIIIIIIIIYRIIISSHIASNSYHHRTPTSYLVPHHRTLAPYLVPSPVPLLRTSYHIIVPLHRTSYPYHVPLTSYLVPTSHRTTPWTCLQKPCLAWLSDLDKLMIRSMTSNLRNDFLWLPLLKVKSAVERSQTRKNLWLNTGTAFLLSPFLQPQNLQKHS